MCNECGKYFCLPACPEFNHLLPGRGSAVAFCSLCGSAIYLGETHYVRGSIAVCSDCEEVMSLCELGLLLDTKEALLLCGFERVC